MNQNASGSTIIGSIVNYLQIFKDAKYRRLKESCRWCQNPFDAHWEMILVVSKHVIKKKLKQKKVYQA